MSELPAGAVQRRPSRPRPAVWKSATAVAPSGSSGWSMACVVSASSAYR